MRHRPIVIALAALMFDCASLDKLPEGTCGNGVVDVNEDCDSFPGQCGAPSAGASACRLTCGDGLPACPTGWGCSVSGFCREPTGTFAPASEPLSAGVTSMLVGDFDGDGRVDLFGSSSVGSSPAKGRILYFGDGAALSQVVNLPAVLASPVVRDFDLDGRDDLAFGYSFSLVGQSVGGIGMVLGQSDRTTVSRLFPSVSRAHFDATVVPLAATVAQVPPGADMFLAIGASVKDGTRFEGIVSFDEDLNGGSRLPYGKALSGITELAGTASGRVFDSDADSTCGEIVVATNPSASAPNDPPSIQVFSPCRPIAAGVVWASAKAPVGVLGISRAEESSVDGVFVADVDSDGHEDVIIAGHSGRIWVAKSNGTTLGPAKVDDDLSGLPLAAADLNDDGVVDFVVRDGILMSVVGNGGNGGDAGADAGGGGRKNKYFRIPSPTKLWTSATVADVNRDGAPDVIGASEFEPDIDVLEGSASLVMPPFVVSTTGPVSHLFAGDFDLDGSNDIAFVQTRAASTESDIAIAYGRPLAMPPESPRIVGRAEGIRQLLPGGIGMTVTTSTPAADGELPTFSLSVVLASGERQPQAPLLLIDDPQKHGLKAVDNRREWLARNLVAAPLVAKDRVDLVTLAAGEERDGASGKQVGKALYSFWLAPGTGPASFATPSETLPLESVQALDPRSSTFSAKTVAMDLDGDQVSEIVVLSVNDADSGATLRIVGASALSAASGAIKTIEVPDLRVARESRAVAADVDQDGHPDLVVTLADATGQLFVDVFFGDGAGGFVGAGVAVPLPKTTDDAPLGVAQLTTGAIPNASGVGAKRQELVIVTPKRLYRAAVRPDRTFDVTDATSALYGESSLPYGSDVATGDFDGDGADDIAIASSGSVRVLRQTTRLP